MLGSLIKWKEGGQWKRPNWSGPLSRQHRGVLLIKKFNSTTAALASEHSEVRPCESWRRLIRRRQILPCWEGAGQGGTAAAHRPSWKGWHPAYSWIWPTLLFPVSPLRGVTGSQSGGKSQGLSCPWSSWERESRDKQGINAGFRLSAAGLGSGSMSPLHTSCHQVLSYDRRCRYTKAGAAVHAVPSKSHGSWITHDTLMLLPWIDFNISKKEMWIFYNTVQRKD